MKKIVMLLMCLTFGVSSYSQCGGGAPGSTCISGDPTNSAGLKTDEMSQVIAGAQHAIGKIEGFYDFVTSNSAKTVSANTTGTTLLFDNWNNSGAIYSDNSKFLLDGVNFDIKKGEFVIKDKDGELYSFTTSKIDKVVINNNVYKTVLNNMSGNYELFQVMHDDDGIEILKGFELVFIEASPNPMVNRKSNKIKKKEVFYSRSADQLSKIRIGKNKLMNLLDEDNHEMLKKEIQSRINRRIVTRS